MVDSSIGNFLSCALADMSKLKYSEPYTTPYQANEPIKNKGDLFLRVKAHCSNLQPKVSCNQCSPEFRLAVEHCLLQHYKVDELPPDIVLFAERYSAKVPGYVKAARSDLNDLYRKNVTFWSTPVPDINNSPPKSPPRKRKKDWEDAASSTKNKRARDVIKKVERSDEPKETVILAAIKCFQDQGKHQAAEALKIIQDNPDDFSENLSSFLKKSEPQKKSPALIKAEKALGVLLDLGLSVDQYEKIRSTVNVEGLPEILPPYYLLQDEKIELRPASLGPNKYKVVVNEHEVYVPMEGLLLKTLLRILEDEDVKQQIDILAELNQGPITIQFISKWGLDGSKVNFL